MGRRKKWKSALRFTLRVSILALTVACVYLGVKANRVAKQRRAVKAILSSGGRVVYDHKARLGERVYSTVDGPLSQILDDDWFYSVEHVTLFGAGCNNAVLRHVGALTSVRGVNLWAWADAPHEGYIGETTNQYQPRAGVTDDGLKALATLPNLEFISFMGNRITDEGIEQLKEFPALKTVMLVDGDSRSEPSRVSQDAKASLKRALKYRTKR